METASHLLIYGLTLGVSSGLAPGPLFTLTISQTLRFGAVEGLKIACAPLITDLPIIALAVLILSRLANISPLLGGVTLLGGLFLIYLGWESISFKGVELSSEPVRPHSFRKGVIANFLNPGPYLFWLTIGGPILIESQETGLWGAVLFVLILYFGLVGSKAAVAVLAGRSRKFLKSGYYVYTLRFLGLVLWGFAVIFLQKSLGYFNII